MKMLLTIALIVGLIFYSGVGFQTSAPEVENFDAPTIVYNAPPGETVNESLFDRGADYRMRIAGHTVKISEDVVYKDVLGVRNTIEDASSGSGAVIEVDSFSNTSLVLTAQHVCETMEKGSLLRFGSIMVVSSKQWVITAAGKKMRARTIIDDEKNDVCVMQVEGIAGTPASVGAFHPPKGGRITTAGAPAGIWDDGVVNITEGFFSGVRSEKICVIGACYFKMLQYSIPIVSGMSGSGVYYNGRIIGLITIGTSRYEHVGWGPGLGPLRAITEEARNIWLDSLPEPTLEK